jgi:hypothetical protein
MQGTRSEIKVKLTRDDQESFLLQDILWNCRLNDPRLFAIWTYGQDPAKHKNYRALAAESFGDLTGPNSGIPFAMAVTREGTNLLAVGLLSQSRVVNVRGWPRENGEYQLHLDTRTPLQTRSFATRSTLTLLQPTGLRLLRATPKQWMNGRDTNHFR